MTNRQNDNSQSSAKDSTKLVKCYLIILLKAVIRFQGGGKALFSSKNLIHNPENVSCMLNYDASIALLISNNI